MKGYLKKIEQINFRLLSPDDIRNMSVVTVETPDTYEDDGFPIEKGLMDPRMGVVDPSLVCRTCGHTGGDCQGHFGSIELARPVIHIGFGDVIHKILRSTCNSCGRVLLPENVLEEYTKKITEAMENKDSISEILKKLQNETKKVEMSDAKQNDIVDKIMKEVYPEGEDNYDDADRKDILLNILDQLYAEAYMERDETEEKPQFKYIDPKQLCPHCKKNQSMADIEASYDMIEDKNADDLHKLHDKIVEDVEDEYEKKIAKIDKKIEKLQESDEVDKDVIAELEEEKTDILAEAEEKTEEKVQKEFKRRLRDFIKQYLQELIQEPILLDKPVTIRQGDYRLTPSEVRERLENITDYDSFVLGVNPEVARPEWLVLTVLPVPPVTVRPSITLDTGERSEDDLTHKLVDILRINQRLLENMEAGAPQLIVDDLWELLQYHVTTYFDNKASGVPPARHRSGRPLITLMQRFNGHGKDAMHDESKGRFRDNLSGKRVNFSARTVMSPDPNIGINEVGVPEIIAKEETVPAYVTEWNIGEMRQYITNGPETHPGANYVIRKDGRKIRIRDEETKELILEQLEPGFIIERHLKDGDIVLLNRHPSLHKLSMLAHEVKVLPYNTFRINPAVCPPYNVDFDGDEMNIHVLQTEESRAESKSLMLVENNMRSPRFGGPLIGAIRDHISGAYLLTKTSTTFSEEEAFQIIKQAGIEMPIINNGQWISKNNSKIQKKKGEMWTGKELFSLSLPDDLNMSFSAELSKNHDVYPPEDAFVVIENGILLQGVIDEAAFGSFKGKILNKILIEYGSKHAREFLEKAISLSLSALMKIGITNSINDYEIPKKAHNMIDDYLNHAIAEVDILVESYYEGHLEPLGPMNLEKTFNIKTSQIFNNARDMAGNIAENHFKLQKNALPFSLLGRHSSVMAHTGAKSSKLNITQISACVGQQSIRGQALNAIFNDRGYNQRLLPHFKKGELNSKSMGFIKSSFLKGLDPIEFFIHAMGGRDSMADKYIRISVSGYMQRRLINALQDVHTDKNYMVKDAQGNVIQMLYGEDGVDSVKSDFGKPADLNKIINEMRRENSNYNKHDSDNNEPDDNSYENLSEKEIKKLKIRSEYLSNKIKYTIKDYSNSIKEINTELKRFNDSEYEIDVNEMLTKLEMNHRDLIKWQTKCHDFKFLDTISEKLINAENDLKIIKKDFKQKLSDIIKLEYKIRDEKFEEYEDLMKKAESIIESKLTIFSNLNSELNDLIDNANEISAHVDKNDLMDNLENIRTEFNKQYNMLNRIENQIYDKDLFYFSSIQQADYEINSLNSIIDDLNQISSEYFEEKIAEQEKDYQDVLSLSEEIQSGNVETLLSECEKYFSRSLFKRQLKKYNLEDDELDIIKNNIKNDIINHVITDENTDFKKLIKTRCKEFRKDNSDFDENKINDVLDKIAFYEIDADIIHECKNKVKIEFLKGNVSINQAEFKLKSYVTKKVNESNQLKDLEKIKNSHDVPSIKIHLTQEEINEIYRVTEKEIRSEYGIRSNVENRVSFWANKKIRENQSEARSRLNIIKRDFSSLTDLNNKQQIEFVNQIEFYINNHKIKYYDITEEYIITLSEDFINNGKLKLR